MPANTKQLIHVTSILSKRPDKVQWIAMVKREFFQSAKNSVAFFGFVVK